MFYTYIIYSKNIDTYYIGSTRDAYHHLDMYNKGHSKYTGIVLTLKGKKSISYSPATNPGNSINTKTCLV